MLVLKKIVLLKNKVIQNRTNKMEQIKKLVESNITELATYSNESLKEMGYQPGHFEEIIELIRYIRTSGKYVYSKVREICATSLDYDKNDEMTNRFFAELQNNFHWATHKHTAAELIAEKADANKPNMGLMTCKGTEIKKSDVSIAKSYMTYDELELQNLLVEQYLSFVESQALQGKVMYLRDHIEKLHEILKINERPILPNTGKMSHKKAKQIAEREFEKYKEKLKQQKALSAVPKSKTPVIKRIVKKKKLVS